MNGLPVETAAMLSGPRLELSVEVVGKVLEGQRGHAVLQHP
jgi:hypothetical protein